MRPTQALRAGLCAVVLCACAIAQERTMQLLAPSTGWALGNGRLFWTADNGERWIDITPGRAGTKIADVFFRDVINGWVLLESNAGDGMIRVVLATTSDGGHIWSFADIPIPKQFPDELSGAGWVDFADAEHGWVVLKNHTSSAFSTARLIQTMDGGSKWQELPQAPLGAPVVFVNSTDGWLAGDSGTGGSGNMYRTRDAGRTWQGADLQHPSAAGLVSAAYGTLRFTDAKHGSVPVTFSPISGQSTLVLFTTSDGGSTWHAAQVLHVPNRYGESPLPSAVVDSTLLVLRSATLVAVGPDSGESSRGIGGVSPDEVFKEMTFIDAVGGWLRTSDGRLVSTADGGRTLTWHVPGSAPRAALSP
jgi:photosystem II stability/assembly factor-like uncharacterized protein